MSLIDFSQEARNQGFLHIAVKDLGEESHSFFNAVLQALTKLPPIQLTEPKGTVLFLRFLNYNELPSWAIKGPKWNEFNPHKQIMGVLGVCKCYDLDDLDNVIAGFKTYSNLFESSLCRCIIYGSKSELEGGNIDTMKGHCLIDAELSSDDIKLDCLTEVVTDFALTIYSTLKSRITHLKDSLRTSTVAVVHSPFESKEYSRPEDDPGELKLSPTVIKARMEKHIADISLLVGDLQMAFHWYTSALQLMRPHQRDNLWYASVNEGLGVTAIIMKMCEEVLGQKAQGFTLNLGPLRKPANSSRVSRVSSSSSGSSTSSPRSTLTSDHRRQSSLTGVDVRSKYSSLRRPTGTVDGDGETEKVNGGIVFKNTAASAGESPSRPVLSDEDEFSIYGEEDDDEGCLQVNEALLHKDFIVDKYTVALKFYEKAKHLGVVSLLEALLKFSKYLIDQKRYRVASDQLQRMLTVVEPSFITDTDKLQLHCTIAEMYRSMGLHRKAALFTHYAARWASKIAKSPDQVIEAYNLIVTCLPDFKLSLQLSELPKNEECYNGWPLIQAQVLKDFVFLSRRKQENELAISHSCYLLRHLGEHLSSGDVQEITSMLKNIMEESSERDSGSPDSAAIKKIQSPLPLENIPWVKSVSLVDLVDLLKPTKIKGFVEPKEILSKEDEQSPFIFSPFEARRRRGKQRPEVLWVVGNPGEIKLIVENTLPFELKASKMLILTEGAQVDIFPTSLTLPSKSEPQDIKLITVPREPGLLDVKGYEAAVFGILHHECKVKITEDRIVRVVPPLPEIRLSVLPASDETPLSPSREGSLRVTRPAITKFELLDGEICKYDFQLECLAKACTDVELVTVTVADYDKDYCDISWDDSEVKALLPILSGSCRSFTVSIRAKIPAWFRVLNEHTQGISKTTVFPSLKHEQSFQDSGHHSHSGNTTPTESPTSSPIAKRTLLAFRSSFKSKSGHDYSSSKESSLMESLNLDHPSLTSPRSTASLPQFRRSPGHQRNTSLGGGTLKRKNRGSKGLPTDLDVFDMKRASMVSTRSDPGEEGKSRPKLPSKGSAESSKAVAIPKSVESRASIISNSPHLYSDNGIPSSVQSSNLHRSSSGNKSSAPRKQQQTPLTKGSISVPMGPLIREKPQPPRRKNLEGEFKIQYSGGGGYVDGYCRQCFTKLPIVVKPCLVFEQFEVLSTERSRELFNLKYFVHNISKIRVEVSVSIDQDYDGDNEKTATSRTLDPNGRSEMVLAIRRFIIDNNKNDGDVTKLYSEKVGEIVKVHWKDLEHNKLGVVALDGLRLSASTVSLMRPIPMTFSFSIDDHTLPLQSSYSHECGVGDQVNVVVTISNSSGVSMAPSFLVFEPQFHSQQQKRLLKDVGHMILHSGSLIVGIPQLDPDKTYMHKLTFVFLLMGKYHMEIKNYLQVEGPPNLHVKLPAATSASQVETATPTICDSKNESTQTRTSVSVSVDTNPSSSLSPPREGPASPPPSQPGSVSPRQSPSPRRSISSPVSPSKLARQMAKMYEAKIVARAAIVYKGPKTDKMNASAFASATKEKASPEIMSPAVERTSESPDINSMKSLASTKTPQRSPEAVFMKSRVNCDRLNILLSQFVSDDSLLKATAVSPARVTRTNNPTPPPLPKGYHGKLANSGSDLNKRFSNTKQDHSSRFQKLLRLRSQSTKSVRVFSGPQITFSVS